MAKVFIKIDRTTTTAVYANDLLSLLQQLRNTVNQLAKVKGIMDNNWVTTDFADLEALFGIPVGSGQAVYALVRDSQKAITGVAQDASALTLIDKVG
jgi:hypothetical protein